MASLNQFMLPPPNNAGIPLPAPPSNPPSVDDAFAATTYYRELMSTRGKYFKSFLSQNCLRIASHSASDTGTVPVATPHEIVVAGEYLSNITALRTRIQLGDLC